MQVKNRFATVVKELSVFKLYQLSIKDFFIFVACLQYLHTTLYCENLIFSWTVPLNPCHKASPFLNINWFLIPQLDKLELYFPSRAEGGRNLIHPWRLKSGRIIADSSPGSSRMKYSVKTLIWDSFLTPQPTIVTYFRGFFHFSDF